MKFLVTIILFLIIFMGMFFLLSTIGLLWVSSYKTIITDCYWFIVYTICIGWWIAVEAVNEIVTYLKEA